MQEATSCAEQEVRVQASSRGLHLRLRSEAVIVVAVIVAIFLRWYGIASQSLWGDEDYTLWLSQLSPGRIWNGVQLDTSPPLYYLLLHFWTRWLGTSEISLRGLSALFETLSVGIFYLLAKRILADTMAVTMAVSLFALCAFQVEYAREARFYGLLVLLSLMSVYWALVFLEKQSISSFCCVVLCLSAGLYTHNMMLFYLPGIAILWLIYPADLGMRRRVISGLFCVVVVTALYMPWLPGLKKQTQTVERKFWISRPTSRDVVESIYILSGLKQDPWSIATEPGKVAGQFEWHAGGLLALWSSWSRKGILLRYGCAVIIACCLCGGLWNVTRCDRRKTVALLGYSFVPIMLAFVISLVSQPVYLNRAFIATSAILPILFVSPLAFQSGNWRRGFAIITLIVFMLVSITLFDFLRYAKKGDWRELTDYIGQKSSERRKVFFEQSLGQFLFDYYKEKKSSGFFSASEAGLPTDCDWRSYVGPTMAELSDAQLIAPLSAAVESKNYNEIDTVLYRPQDRLKQRTLEYLTTHCTSLHEADFVGDVRIVECKLIQAP